MANYIAAARSNKFRVKDIAALEAAMPVDIEVNIESIPDRLVCLLVTNDDGAGWPCMIYDETTEEDIDFNIVDAVTPHLEDDEWCVIKEVGAEKLRYLIGYTTAFNSKGDCITISLDDIYQELPETVTTCDY